MGNVRGMKNANIVIFCCLVETDGGRVGEGSACPLPRVGLPLPHTTARIPVIHLAVHSHARTPPFFEFTFLNICVCVRSLFLKLGFSMSDIKAVS